MFVIKQSDVRDFYSSPKAVRHHVTAWTRKDDAEHIWFAVGGNVYAGLTREAAQTLAEFIIGVNQRDGQR